MVTHKSVSQRLGWLLERVTGQSGRLPDTPEYGSWLLGHADESRQRRRVRVQLILTTLVAVANLLGIAVALLVVAVAIPQPSVYAPDLAWLTWGVVPACVVLAFVIGTIWTTCHAANVLHWSIEDRAPTEQDLRNTFLVPSQLTRIHLVLWGAGAVLLAAAYGLSDPAFIPKYLFAMGFSGIVVATICYLFTEFALRPFAAQALAAGRPPRRIAPGVMGRIMTVWVTGSGVPLLGIVLTALFAPTMNHLTRTQFVVAVVILGTLALIFGFISMWIIAWLTATPVRVVRTALKQVEDGELNTQLVVFDGTELGELQRGFNSMVHGLRERERVRDLFGRHVGREVAAYAEQNRIELGGEECHVAVVFVDVAGSTQLAAERPAMEVVELLNRLFGVIVDEVDLHHGLLNKFEGDATLAVFGAPVHLRRPENNALSAARHISRRLRDEVPECPAGVGVAAGKVVAGHVGARKRFEYTVIGDPVNEAARLSDLAKLTPTRLLASSVVVELASDNERDHWDLGDEVMLSGRNRPTRLAGPIED